MKKQKKIIFQFFLLNLLNVWPSKKTVGPGKKTVGPVKNSRIIKRRAYVYSGV